MTAGVYLVCGRNLHQEVHHRRPKIISVTSEQKSAKSLTSRATNEKRALLAFDGHLDDLPVRQDDPQVHLSFQEIHGLKIVLENVMQRAGLKEKTKGEKF